MSLVPLMIDGIKIATYTGSMLRFINRTQVGVNVPFKSSRFIIYSRTSVARTLMARLPRLFRTRS